MPMALFSLVAIEAEFSELNNSSFKAVVNDEEDCVFLVDENELNENRGSGLYIYIVFCEKILHGSW